MIEQIALLIDKISKIFIGTLALLAAILAMAAVIGIEIVLLALLL